MTDTTDTAALMLKMRTLADRIIDAEGENNNGEVGKIIEMYDAADTTFKAQNILLVLNTFEAERQRADDEAALNKHLDLAVRQNEGINNNLRRRAVRAEAELAALKGDQVPVYQMYYDGFWRDVDKEHHEHFKKKGSDVRVLFTASQNLVVRPRLEPCLKQVQFERDCEWIEEIKAAGGIVKDGD